MSNSAKYTNILMLDMDGLPLSTISNGKFRFYVSKKQLAKTLTEKEEEPWKKLGYSKIIQLLIPTQAKGKAFNISPKPNICFCCGQSKNLTTHHVIPKSIRQYMSNKNHQHAWCVILCNPCHEKAEQIMRELIDKPRLNWIKQKQTSRQIKKDLNTLTTPTIPKAVADKIVKHYITEFGVGQNKRAVIQMLKKQSILLPTFNELAKQWNLSFISLYGEEGISNLCRKAFISLNPKYLPIGYLEYHH